MSDGNNQEGTASQAPNGGWFRRERERIAVGRKPMARLLGTTESKLATLEQRKQDVPPQWLGVLADLGFRVPEWALGGLPNVSAAEADATIPQRRGTPNHNCVLRKPPQQRPKQRLQPQFQGQHLCSLPAS